MPQSNKSCSVRNAAAVAPSATVSKPLPKYASSSAVSRPARPETMLDVEYKISGNVMAAKTA